MNTRFQGALEKGLAFLDRDQFPNGSFLCLVSTVFDDYESPTTVPAIVPTNIVLSSLAHLSGFARAERIKEKSAAFLLTQKNAYWSLNYWFRSAAENTWEPYPDDTDDTFCALAALYQYDPSLFDGDVLAKITTMLTSCEKKEGGPYDMWLVPPEARNKWNDTDLVVNSNIAFFLSLLGVSLPNVDAFIEQSIDEEDYEFPYNTVYPGIYFVSRFYKGDRRRKMIDFLLDRQEIDGKWENPLRTALAVSALLNLTDGKISEEILKGIEYLIATQEGDGSWAAYSFYFQMKKAEKTLYAGSRSITTALCLEAISKVVDVSAQSAPHAASLLEVDDSVKGEGLYEEIVHHVRGRLSGLGVSLEEAAERVLSRVTEGEKGRRIALLPDYFLRSLHEELQGKVQSRYPSLMHDLGAATLFGWIAYTVYDDFLDEEGDARLLSVANIAMRESIDIFTACVSGREDAISFVKKTFDTIDATNAWETATCRLGSSSLTSFAVPDFGDYMSLAHRSIGHALGPVVILLSLGFDVNSDAVQRVLSFFSHYLIARQLDDDAHDWEEDLRKGQVNAVSVDVFALERSQERMREVFWSQVVIGVCDRMTEHVELARKSLVGLEIFGNTRFFDALLLPIEMSTEKVMRERREMERFFQSYKPNSSVS